MGEINADMALAIGIAADVAYRLRKEAESYYDTDDMKPYDLMQAQAKGAEVVLDQLLDITQRDR